MFEVKNLLHWWQQGHPLEFIRRGLGVDPKTTRKYIKLAIEAGIGKDTPLTSEALKPLLDKITAQRRERAPASQTREELDPHRQTIGRALGLESGGEEDPKSAPITIKSLWRRLGRNNGIKASYSAFKRYVRHTFPESRRGVTIVMPQGTPGDAAQVDFGYVGLMLDVLSGRLRKTWAFVLTLTYSRHMFVRFVFGQDKVVWSQCHAEAWEYFGGVVERVLVDNLKAGVVKPDLYDPTINRTYAECARHYKFVVDPCRVKTPTDKAKVERMVPYVRDALVRGYELTGKPLKEANDAARHWCLTEAGHRNHGTLLRHPIEVFVEEESRTLKPLPADRFEIPIGKEATVHPDHHLIFERGFYSLPTRYVGEKVWVRGTATAVQVFDKAGYLIRTWEPATTKDRWRTNWNDYPPGKRAYLSQHPRYCRARAEELGPSVREFVDEVLASHSHAHLRKVQGILRLGDKYGAARLNFACARALAYEDLGYRTVKNILVQGLELESQSDGGAQEVQKVETFLYLRPADSFVHSVQDDEVEVAA
jgi:transposase